MDHGPESIATKDVLYWLACERDAEWATKLAILRASRCEEIRYFGDCLREHARHAEELAALARTTDRNAQISREPPFVTTDPFVVGAVEDGRALLEVMDQLEGAWIDRYLDRHAGGGEPSGSSFQGLLVRHLTDTRARRDRLRGLRESRRDRAA